MEIYREDSYVPVHIILKTRTEFDRFCLMVGLIQGLCEVSHQDAGVSLLADQLREKIDSLS